LPSPLFFQCDTIATGIVDAVKTVNLKVPLVVRLAGTNVELGKKVLRESGVNVIAAEDLDDAAIKAVKCIKA
jgi:succinyl-CoA synthetase beta subunit